MISKNIANEQGFTLIELMVAMAIFTFMLTIILVGYLGVARSRQSGVVQRNTQQNGRLAMDQVTKAIQLSTFATPTVVSLTPSEIDRICIEKGGQSIALEVTTITVSTGNIKTLVQNSYPNPNCTGTILTTNRLTDNSVTVTQFKTSYFGRTQNALGAVSVVLSVASVYGVNYLNSTQTGCNAGGTNQFCSVSTMQSVAVLKGSRE